MQHISFQNSPKGSRLAMKCTSYLLACGYLSLPFDTVPKVVYQPSPKYVATLLWTPDSLIL